MQLSDLALNEVVGVELPGGDQQFFQRTLKGLEGPFLDRECSVPYMAPELREEVDRNAQAHRLYPTGKREKFRHFRFTDGVVMEVNKHGSAIRTTPKTSKKARLKLGKENRTQDRQQGSAPEAVREEASASAKD